MCKLCVSAYVVSRAFFWGEALQFSFYFQKNNDPKKVQNHASPTPHIIGEEMESSEKNIYLSSTVKTQISVS